MRQPIRCSRRMQQSSAGLLMVRLATRGQRQPVTGRLTPADRHVVNVGGLIWLQTNIICLQPDQASSTRHQASSTLSLQRKVAAQAEALQQPTYTEHTQIGGPHLRKHGGFLPLADNSLD